MTTVISPPRAPATQPASPGRGRKALDALDERLGIGALEYPVPAHANNLAWSLGGVTAGAFGILIVTGFILVQFYSPVPETANASVRHIVTGVAGGWFVRGVHSWASQAMYVTAFLHLARVILHRLLQEATRSQLAHRCGHVRPGDPGACSPAPC